MKWFKMWNEILTEPGIHKMSHVEFRLWTTLLAISSIEDTQGCVPAKYNAQDLSRLSAINVRTIEKTVEGLLHAGHILVTSAGDIEIPNWEKYQSDTSKRYARDDGKNPPQTRLDKTRLDKIREEAETILAEWQNIYPKARPTTGVMKSINARLDNYSAEDICQAIKNYAASTEEFWRNWRDEKRGWSLEQFLSRGEGEKIDKFLPGPINEIRKGSAPGPGTHRAITCEGEIFDGEGTCLDIELNEQGVCAKQKTCPNFRKHE